MVRLKHLFLPQLFFAEMHGDWPGVCNTILLHYENKDRLLPRRERADGSLVRWLLSLRPHHELKAQSQHSSEVTHQGCG